MLSPSPPTYIALERLLLGVLPLVHLQLPLADELLAAVVAGVQLLPGVDQFVSGEGYSARVVLIAHIALEPLPCPAIRLHVILQTLPGQELLPAFFTYFTGEILAIVDLLNVSDVAAWGVVDALADLTADLEGKKSLRALEVYLKWELTLWKS